MPSRTPDRFTRDRWMLDIWEQEAKHVITTYRKEEDASAEVTTRDDYRPSYVYQMRCSCGWRALDFHQPTVEACPVYAALTERRKRLPKFGATDSFVVDRSDAGTAPGRVREANGRDEAQQRVSTGIRVRPVVDPRD